MLTYRRSISIVFIALCLGFTSVFAQVEEQVEVLDLKIEKSVDNPVPIGAQPVEFKIVVTNVGEKPATGVIVEDKLPQVLAIPDGLAAFTSSGNYDSSMGLWVVGDIAVGEEEIMTLPAVVIATPQPPCIINSANLLAPKDAASSNDVASMALKLPGIERCVDVLISQIYGPTTTPLCGDQVITRQFVVTNSGPDEAQNVVLTVAETAYMAPGFELISPGCSGLACNWPSIPAGERVEVSASSGLFSNSQTLEHSVTATVTTTDEDYAPENNVASDGGTIDPFTGDCPGLPDYEGTGAGGSSPLCFVATAAYSTPFDERIDKLRHFRDHTLTRFQAGRVFIDWYYSYSPPLAKYIASRPIARAVVRALLVPILLAIDYPFGALAAFVMGIFLMLISWRAYILSRRHAGKNRQAAGI